MRVYDESGDRIETLTYEDEDKIEYELNLGTYDFLIEIIHDFKDDVKCELFIDDRNKEKISFTSKSGISDKRIENDFNSNITLICTDKLDKAELYVFESTYKSDGKLLDQYTYKDKSTIELKYKSEEKTEEIIEEEKETTTQPPEPQNQNITQNLDEENLIADQNSNNNELNASSEEILQNQTEKNTTSLNQTESAKLKTFGKVLFVFFIIIVIVVLIMGALKAKKQAKKRQPSHKHKVDLEYLKKRK